MTFLRNFETLLQRNKNLKRVNIFFPLHVNDLIKFADISLPRIIGTTNSSLLNFYQLNCLNVREDNIGPDFLQNVYTNKASVISSKNYKAKKSIEVMLP